MGERGFSRTVDRVGKEAAFEEALFLGLRLVEGVDLARLNAEFGMNGLIAEPVREMSEAGLVAAEVYLAVSTVMPSSADKEAIARAERLDGCDVPT